MARALTSKKLNEVVEILIEKFPILSPSLARKIILLTQKFDTSKEETKKTSNRRAPDKIAFELSQFCSSKRKRTIYASTSELMSFGNLSRHQAAAQISNHVKRGDLMRMEDGRYRVTKRFW
jgi:predicted HTH transcriptional regulator